MFRRTRFAGCHFNTSAKRYRYQCMLEDYQVPLIREFDLYVEHADLLQDARFSSPVDQGYGYGFSSILLAHAVKHSIAIH